MNEERQKIHEKPGYRNLINFLQKNRLDFPEWMKTVRIAEAFYNDRLIQFIRGDKPTGGPGETNLVGFIEVDNEKVKNLFISEQDRDDSAEILTFAFEEVKRERTYLTMLVDETNSTTMNVAKKAGFTKTDTKIENSSGLLLTMFEWGDPEIWKKSTNEITVPETEEDNEEEE